MPTSPRAILALASLLPPEMKRLDDRFRVVRLYNEPDPEKTLQAVRNDVVGILSTAGGHPVRRPLIEALPNLEIITQFGVGVDNIDLDAARERGIAVTNTPDVLTDDTADIAVALLLALSRRICEADMFVRVGKWSGGPMPLGTTPKGKTAGIVGLGRIGRAIAKRLTAFDMRIAYHGRKRKPDLAWSFYNDLESLAKDADYLICAVPGGPDTYHMVNDRVLAALGPKGYLINIARGSVVDQDALVAALSAKTIAGAGLDVFANEPAVPDTLKTMDNVVLLPHIGSATLETRTIMGEIVLANLDAYFSGKPLITPVN
ncbi:MAG: 2-hydroxyacid dehydrogenase [Rhodospirillales bacterium]|nr:2-hydroxyacid dehydrogenase [Alphaproteobacteria bacterium]MCB9987437.1 2-hydroxyacid dehydrogenase [Rhodospirillales bacterium]USO07581.1 MAG: 2-hydroxyacid dehydrogenase [Rhodospirillales bacterium]